MKLIKEVKAKSSHRGEYQNGVIYLPKEWIGKKVEIRTV